MPQQPDDQAVPPELGDALAKYGITLASGGVDEGSLYGFGALGGAKVTVRRLSGSEYAAAVQRYAGTVSGPIGLGPPGGEETTLIGAAKDFYTLPKSDLVRLKQRLWLHGFYEGSDPPALTADPDDRTFEAYRRALLRAARSQESLWDDILKPVSGADAATALRPEEIRAINENVIPKIIGRKFSDDELARFVAAFHTDLETSVVSPGELISQRAKETAEKVAPGEAESFGVLNRMQTFLGMLDELGAAGSNG